MRRKTDIWAELRRSASIGWINRQRLMNRGILQYSYIVSNDHGFYDTRCYTFYISPRKFYCTPCSQIADVMFINA